MKIYTEFNLATLPRMVKFMELNISEFQFLNFGYTLYKQSLNGSSSSYN